MLGEIIGEIILEVGIETISCFIPEISISFRNADNTNRKKKKKESLRITDRYKYVDKKKVMEAKNVLGTQEEDIFFKNAVLYYDSLDNISSDSFKSDKLKLINNIY